MKASEDFVDSRDPGAVRKPSTWPGFIEVSMFHFIFISFFPRAPRPLGLHAGPQGLLGLPKGPVKLQKSRESLELINSPEGSQGLPEGSQGLREGSPGLPVIYLHLDFPDFLPEGSPGLSVIYPHLDFLDFLPEGSPATPWIRFCLDFLDPLARGLPRSTYGSLGLPSANSRLEILNSCAPGVPKGPRAPEGFPMAP